MKVFLELRVLASKFVKFVRSVLKQQVSFSPNFASPFSVMRHNSSLLFHLKRYMHWTKGARESANIQTFDCSHEN